MCLIQILISGVYVLALLVTFARRWPGFEVKRFLVLTAPAKPTTTIRIDGGWRAAAAVRSGGGRCSDAPSLIGDLDGMAATANTNDGRSLLFGEYYYCGGVGGWCGRVFERRAWEVRFFTGFFVCFAVIPM